jgi:hypothetical protein
MHNLPFYSSSFTIFVASSSFISILSFETIALTVEMFDGEISAILTAVLSLIFSFIFLIFSAIFTASLALR